MIQKTTQSSVNRRVNYLTAFSLLFIAYSIIIAFGLYTVSTELHKRQIEDRAVIIGSTAARTANLLRNEYYKNIQTDKSLKLTEETLSVLLETRILNVLSLLPEILHLHLTQ